MGTNLLETDIGAIDIGILVFDAADHLVLANPWALKLHPALSDLIEAKESRQATGERLLGESS